MHIAMLRLTLGLALLSLAAGSECPSQQLCGDQQTCCQVQSTGEYNCCPFHQGECCEDHLHCCPEGMLCQTAESKCSNSTHSLPWTERTSAKQMGLAKSFRMISSSVGSKDNIVCPDNSSCPAEFSCLKLPDRFGCCPVMQGIVCADGKHCCPNDHECSVDSTSCVKKKEPVRAVMCPDGVSECPMQTSCCETAEGGWGCCPMPKAVCCEDKVHCCPEDSVCHVNGSKCVTSTKQELPMWAKFPARLRAEWEDHKAVAETPKTTTKQPETTTVLTTTSPTTTTTTTTATTTTTTTTTTVRVDVWKGSDVPCDDTVGCPDETTCCKTAQGEWACCPLPQAVCCEDFVHCCPHGTKCNLTADTCDDPSGSTPWLKKIPSRPIRGKKPSVAKGSDVPCNDTVGCPDETTCCKTAKGDWACCPLPQAVCCEDLLHCCPHGTKCNPTADTCDDPSGSVPWVKKIPSRPIRGKKPSVTEGSDVPCNDTVGCPDETTCCKTAQGEWACCPLPQAVCCEDLLHCCPHGTKCNPTADTCDDPSGSVPWVKKIPSRPIRGKKPAVTKGSDVPCDDTVGCPDETTCCKTAQGEWACCPLPQAVCCEDFVHCCPHGTKCNLTADTCDDPSGSTPWLKKIPSRPIRGKKPSVTEGSDVPCDDTVGCPDETTCCKTAQGEWACCPLPQAVCCEDLLHCCPHGTKCNLTADTCDDPSGSVPWVKKIPSRPIRGKKPAVTEGSDVPCDDTVGCPDETTCCKTAKGEWACCPLPQAVCCEDFVHCCPHGTKCNLTADTCDDPSGSVPWVKKIPSRPIRGKKPAVTEGSDVPCNDTVACPDETTCCKTAKGEWACCPLPQAVCCEDFVHCCPHGTKCNLTADTCDDPSGSVPWVKKIPSRPIRGRKPPVTKGSDVPCDDTVACPDETTCCKTAQGEWACCPLPQAVCCEDFVHCCPHGKKCNLTAETCEDPSGSAPWVKKIPSRPIRGHSDKVKGQNAPANVSCDSSHSCPQSSSCCKDVDADWGCCPFAQGVCCEDHLHCCPQDYTCNFRALTCDKDETSVQMAMIVQEKDKKKVEEPKEDHGHGDVQCDKHNSCPDHTTCCFISKTKKWGCCPLPNAVCCQDGEHCCPAQYKCDPTQTSCIKGDVVIPWYTKVAAESSSDHSAVRCDSQTSCPVSATCCRLGNGKWGCCPLPEATCCPDQEHCCPKGYSCDEGSSSCVKSIVLQIETLPLTNIKQLHSDVQCGGGYTCKDPETCCKTSESAWGCCPYEQAVCCSDMKHCCPAGYNCLDGGVCSQTAGFSWNHWQVFFSRKKRALLV